MKKISLLLSFAFCLSLAACRQVPAGDNAAGTPLASTPTATPQVIKVSSTPTAEPSTPLPKTVSLKEIGVSSPDMVKAFEGIQKLAHKESDGRYSVSINGEKYFLAGGWNLYAELNNAFAPATVNAVDAQGNQIVLIWNTEGLAINSPLSVDIENPTDFDNSSKLTTLQKFLLQNPDPFTEKSRGLVIRSEWTENGKVSYLRTDYFGNQSKPSSVWLRYKAPNGNIYYVNPTNINGSTA